MTHAHLAQSLRMSRVIPLLPSLSGDMLRGDIAFASDARFSLEKRHLFEDSVRASC